MIKHLNVSMLAVSLFVGCGGGGTPTLETSTPTQNILTEEDTSTQGEAPATSKIQSTNVSVNSCIDETLNTLAVTKSTLTKLDCANLTDRNFNLLSTLPSLKELSIIDTALNATDVENIANNINQSQMTTLILENDALVKASVDRIDPNFSYGNKHYTSLTHLSFKNNDIEGLYVVDFFPNLETLDLSGNIYDAARLHHIGFIEALQTLNIGNNPTITHLNNMSDSPKAEGSVKNIDITNMSNLTDISELTQFQVLETVTIDNTQESQFTTTLSTLKAKGVQVIIR